MAGKVYVGDIGTEILIDLQENISMATEHVLLVKKPDGTKVEWPALIYQSNYLQYICQDGDLDQRGKFKLQPKISIPGWHGLGETVMFKVHAKWC